ncbi:MAG: hypothetical protein M1814_004496 [Vezdaea aestivalis]|nr:MAG: hypothetical protein M1814_004496 [Vezdaea aestivalis]
MPGRTIFGRKAASAPSTLFSSTSHSDNSIIASLRKASRSNRNSLSLDLPDSNMDFLGLKSAKHSAASEPAVKLDMQIESPPLVLFGPMSSSTGALLSGQLKIVVTVPEVTLESLSMQFLANVSTKKPVAPHCKECMKQSTELYKWTFHSDAHRLTKGIHSYPFSYLLPGNLPASSFGKLGHIDYVLSARATSPLSSSRITFDRPIKVQRAIQPLLEKTSVRIFPPTLLTTSVTFPPMIHPIGQNNVFLRLDGVNVRAKGMQTRWRLRKVIWRLEENSKIVSPACAKHAPKVGGEGKGIAHQDGRVVGEGEYKSGWKTDFSGNGQIEFEFKCAPRPDRDAMCDVESPTGLCITHNLVLELIVAEEYCYDRTPNAVTPTGSARVLRMQFATIVTERAGLGISWDEEQPPMYTDVPPSPPTYLACVEHYCGPPLEEPNPIDRKYNGRDYGLSPPKPPRGDLMASDTTVVDIHTHIYPPSYIELLRNRAKPPLIRNSGPNGEARLIILPGEDDPSRPAASRGRPIGLEYYDIKQKIKFMDEHRISISVISLANPWLDFLPPEEAPKVVRSINNDIDQICALYHGRLFAFAALPMSAAPSDIVQEIKHLESSKYVRGFIMGTGGLGSGLDDSRLDSVFAVLDSIKRPIFLHPHYGLPNEIYGPRASEYGHVLPLALGFPLETTIAVTRMFLGGVWDRYRNITVLIAHSGGTLPFLAGRIQSCIEHDHRLAAEYKSEGRRSLDDVLANNILLDAVTYSPGPLKAAVESVGKEKIMFGTDHPFFPPLDTQSSTWPSVLSNLDAIKETFGPVKADETDILGGNAIRILNLDASS